MSSASSPMEGFRKLQPYLRLAAEKRASDVYFSSGSPAMIRIEGEMHPVGREALSGREIATMADAMLSDAQRKELQERRAVDLATQAGGLGRFRINVFYQRGELAMVLRFVGADVPTIAGLGLPEILADLALQRRGLILVVGATGSGKSTTMAAMLDERNRKAQGHLLTIEDPIEYVHAHKRCLVNQREVGIDVPDYDSALVSAMREAPDVVMVGEIRVRSTMPVSYTHLTLPTILRV